jgi:hypothetical protein
VSSGVGYNRRTGYGSVRRDRYDRRVESVNRAVSVRGAEYDRRAGSDWRVGSDRRAESRRM